MVCHVDLHLFHLLFFRFFSTQRACGVRPAQLSRCRRTLIITYECWPMRPWTTTTRRRVWYYNNRVRLLSKVPKRRFSLVAGTLHHSVGYTVEVVRKIIIMRKYYYYYRHHSRECVVHRIVEVVQLQPLLPYLGTRHSSDLYRTWPSQHKMYNFENKRFKV